MSDPSLITDSVVLAWLEACDVELYTPDSREISSLSLGDLLRNGVILCRLMNKMFPNTVAKIHTSSLLHFPSRQFLCMENINRFQDAAIAVVGMDPKELLNPEDVYQMNNMDKTRAMLTVLSRKAIEKGSLTPPIESKLAKVATSRKMSPEEFRLKIVDEIRITEQTYVKDLMFLIQAYMKPLRQQSVLGRDEHRKLFGNIVDIFEFQKNFYKRLSETTSKEGAQQRIGAIFLDHKEGFKVYTNYCSNHPNAVGLMIKLDLSPKWKAFAEEWSRRNNKMFDIASSLIKPIQRICKYPLLLRELLRHTPESHPDYDDISDSMDAMNAVTMYINEMKRKMENLQVIFELRQKISNWNGLPLLKSGELLQDGMVSFAEDPKPDRMPAYLLLLAKQMVICKKLKKKEEYEYLKAAPVESLTLFNLSDEKLANGFNIIVNMGATTEVWSIQCRNSNEKQAWLAALGKTIKLDENGYKSTSMAIGAVAQSDRESKFAASAAPVNKIRFVFGKVKLMTDDQIGKELKEQTAQHDILQQQISALSEPSKQVARDLRSRKANIEELEDELRRRADAKSAMAAADAALSGIVKAPAAPKSSGEKPPSALSSTGVVSATTTANRRLTIADMESMLSDIERFDLSDMMPPISEEQEASADSSAGVSSINEDRKEKENTADIMMELANELEDARTKCAHCNKGMKEEEQFFALGKAWHQEHFTCTHCNKMLKGLTFYDRNGKPYCDEDYQKLFNTCAHCQEPIKDSDFVTLGDGNSGNRWHKEHFNCTECSKNLLSEKIFERAGKLYCDTDFQKLFGIGCALCCGLIESGNYLMALDKQWHEKCFVCNYEDCRTPFPDGKFYSFENSPYCELHFHKLSNSLCGHCGKPVSGKHVRSSTSKYHAECFYCSKCNRLLELTDPVQEVLEFGISKFLCTNCV